MNRKSIITCLVFIALLSGAIGVAVWYLYKDVPSDSGAVRVEVDMGEPAAGPELPKPVAAPSQETVAEDTVKANPIEVTVPEGPFRVRNSVTGKTCYIGQSKDDAIYMESEGKTQWTIPFEGRICGRVACIDYFENGKLQYLFISGNRMHLFDRLGKSVRTFPKTLGKEVLLGPDAYDFNNTRVYNIMVLNKDNTIDMYNMKGQKPASWKGITHKEKITGLPELVEISGKSYWTVRTSENTVVYPFYGGSPVSTFPGSDVEIKPTTILKN